MAGATRARRASERALVETAMGGSELRDVLPDDASDRDRRAACARNRCWAMLVGVGSGGDALLVLRATVRRRAEKIFARELSEASRRLRSEGERRLGRRRLDQGVRWEEERTDTEHGIIVTLRAYPA